MNFTKLMEFLKPCFWRLIFTVAGFGVALSFLLIGTQTTIFVLLCCIIGYFFGALHDKNISLADWLRNLRGKLR